MSMLIIYVRPHFCPDGKWVASQETNKALAFKSSLSKALPPSWGKEIVREYLATRYSTYIASHSNVVEDLPAAC